MNKKLYFIMGGFVLVFATLFMLFKNNSNDNKGFIVYSASGKKLKNNLVIGANTRDSFIIQYNNTTDNAINYGAFYEILSSDFNKTAFVVYDISNEENGYDSVSGSSDKEVIYLLVQVVNSSNRDVSINFGVKASNLELTYGNNEYAIGKDMVNIPNEPVIKDGLIPVYYDEFSSSWKKANLYNEDNNWYNYESKKWANAVIVKENLKDKYLNMDDDSLINEDDVIGYFVWIPRYSYMLFNTDYNYLDVSRINVYFSLKSDKKYNGSLDDEWLTHPAFTFGNTELEGIWVGKFETTGSAANPTIKPNLNPLVNLKVSDQFNTSLKFSSYLNGDDVDSHMMKNTEWGAVTYLAYSKYGKCVNDICSDIRNNNVNTLATGHGVSITGCSSISQNDDMVVSNSCNSKRSRPYNDISNGVLASTTGSIYGIYDMNGGSWEVTMGVLTTTEGLIYTGFNNTYNSGFSGKFWDNKEYNGVSLPDKKYYDAYTYFVADDLLYTNPILGDATGETMFMNDDYLEFLHPTYPWFIRGGSYFLNSNSGIFAFASTGGSEFSNIKTFRTVLAYTK